MCLASKFEVALLWHVHVGAVHLRPVTTSLVTYKSWCSGAAVALAVGLPRENRPETNNVDGDSKRDTDLDPGARGALRTFCGSPANM